MLEREAMAAPTPANRLTNAIATVCTTRTQATMMNGEPFQSGCGLTDPLRSGS